jgi:hypothetical protein
VIDMKESLFPLTWWRDGHTIPGHQEGFFVSIVFIHFFAVFLFLMVEKACVRSLSGEITDRSEYYSLARIAAAVENVRLNRRRDERKVL